MQPCAAVVRHSDFVPFDLQVVAETEREVWIVFDDQYFSVCQKTCKIFYRMSYLLGAIRDGPAFEGKAERKRCSGTHCACYVDATSLHIQKLAADGQAESCSSVFAGKIQTCL